MKSNLPVIRAPVPGTINFNSNGIEMLGSDRKNYIPLVGDSIAARRKVTSKIYVNLIVGPVIVTWENACRVVTNQGTNIEGDFQLFYSDWNFQFLHKTRCNSER